MKEKQRANLIPILLALVVMLCWGSLYPTVKLGYEKFDIDTAYYPNLVLFAGLRFTVSGAVISSGSRMFVSTFGASWAPAQPASKSASASISMIIFLIVIFFIPEAQKQYCSSC